MDPLNQDMYWTPITLGTALGIENQLINSVISVALIEFKSRIKKRKKMAAIHVFRVTMELHDKLTDFCEGSWPTEQKRMSDLWLPFH